MNGKQLRNSILQWAIQGKLVPQDPNDDPASVLLEKIRAEKARLVREGKLKKDKNESLIYRGEDNSHYEKFLATGVVKCIDSEIPFDIPSGWEWVRLGSLCSIFTGATFRKEEANKDGIGVRILRGGNISPFKLEMKVDDLYISCDKVNESILLKRNDIVTPAVTSLESIGKTARVNESMGNVTVGGFVFLLRGHLNDDCLSKYLQIAMSSPTAIEFMQSITNKSGQAFYNIGKERLLTALIPIPPYEEQRRIVVCFEHLLPHINKYSETQMVLDELNTDIYIQLKKSILQEAIQGKLVPQDPTEGTAKELLQQIRVEKIKLVKEGKLKKQALVDSTIYKGDDNRYLEKLSNGTVKCIDEEIPFDIPDSWMWVRVENIFNLGSARRVHERDWRNKGIPFYRAREIGVLSEYGYVNNELFIDKELYELFSDSGVPEFGDLMVTAVGTLGKVYVVQPNDIFYYKDGSVICFKNVYGLNSIFYKRVIESNAFIEQYIRESQGTTVSTLTMVRVNKYLVPLPPLEEQQRIVSQVERLFEKLQ